MAAEGCIFVVAGFAGEETRDMYAFDLSKRSWEDWSAHRCAALE